MKILVIFAIIALASSKLNNSLTD